MKPIYGIDEEMKPITRIVSVWEQKVLEKASRERYIRPNVQLDLAPEAARALRDAKERIMDQHRDTFQSTLGNTDDTFQDRLKSSHEIHLGGQQSPERGVFQPQQQPRFHIGGQTRGFDTFKPRFVEIMHPNLFPFRQEPRYEEVDYTQGGARKRDYQRPELIVDNAHQGRTQQVPPFRR